MTIEEALPEPANPVGVDGIEFVEYVTPRPQEFGALLQKLGFQAVARHRSREVMLYRQGGMNLIVNAHLPKRPTPALSAVALRVRDAAFAHQRSLDLGAWDQPTRAAAMELNIPGIHGAGDSLIYFVDRYQDFSIYDVDFVPLPGAEPRPPALAGLHWFGIVQSILADRTGDWLDFYQTLFGFARAAAGPAFRRAARGHAAREPLPQVLPAAHRAPSRIGATAPGRRAWCESAWALRTSRGRPGRSRSGASCSSIAARCSRARRGALTQVYLGGVTFELVSSHLAP